LNCIAPLPGFVEIVGMVHTNFAPLLKVQQKTV
jgi:hypothetical protein